MSLAEAAAISAVRSLSIALFALPVMCVLCRALRGQSATFSHAPFSRDSERSALAPWPHRARALLCRVAAKAWIAAKQWSAAPQFLWMALLAPLFTPGLLPAYAWSNFRVELFGASLSLVHHPVWNEAVYSLVVAMTAVPAGIVVLYFAPPPPLSAEAAHCRRLLLRADAGLVCRAALELRLWFAGNARSLLPAGAVVFLIAFQEFEIGSLMSVTAGTSSTPVTWTGKLYDTQQLVPSAGATLRMAVLPVLIEAAVIVPVLAMLVRGGRLPAARAKPPAPPRWPVRIIAWVWAASALLVVVVLPAATVLEDLPSGLGSLGSQPALGRAVATSVVFALDAGLVAWVAAAVALGWSLQRSGGWRFLAPLSVALPGLLGSLVLCLTVLAVFQRWLPMFYDRPLLLELALVLFLVPRAMLVQLLLRASSQREAVHAAELLEAAPDVERQAAAASVSWRLIGRGRFWAVVLLCHWGYWDLTAPAVLIPAGLDTAPMMLYRLMHYGRNDVYSAMLCLTALVPLVLIGTGWISCRLCRPRRST
ncbi:MAG: hypothetical protein KY476_11860 [Planctomycetes bacterium]|nr:hypothetical protein [Planctomycetota bacterium]